MSFHLAPRWLVPGTKDKFCSYSPPVQDSIAQAINFRLLEDVNASISQVAIECIRKALNDSTLKITPELSSVITNDQLQILKLVILSLQSEGLRVAVQKDDSGSSISFDETVKYQPPNQMDMHDRVANYCAVGFQRVLYC